MQEVLVATTVESTLQDLSDVLENRNLIYDRLTNQLYIKYQGLRPRYYKVDGGNIITKEADGINYISLADEPVVKSTDVSPDNVVHNKNGILVANAINEQSSIYLVVKESDTINETFCGELCRFGDNVSEMYHVSISSKNKSNIQGSSGTTKSASIKKYSYNGETYIGIKFQNNLTSNLYFHGFSNIDRLAPPDAMSYMDDLLMVLED